MLSPSIPSSSFFELPSLTYPCRVYRRLHKATTNRVTYLNHQNQEGMARLIRQLKSFSFLMRIVFSNENSPWTKARKHWVNAILKPSRASSNSCCSMSDVKGLRWLFCLQHASLAWTGSLVDILWLRHGQHLENSNSIQAVLS